MLIPRQSYHNDYVYSDGRVALSDGDGTTFITQVPVVCLLLLGIHPLDGLGVIWEPPRLW
jgi:hypothetical protein